MLWYGKTTPANDDAIFVAVNLDVTRTIHSMVDVPLDALRLGPDEPYRMHELLSDTTWNWRGPRGYVKLDPESPAQIFALERRPA